MDLSCQWEWGSSRFGLTSFLFLPCSSKPTLSKLSLLSSVGISSSAIGFYRWKKLRFRSRVHICHSPPVCFCAYSVPSPGFTSASSVLYEECKPLSCFWDFTHVIFSARNNLFLWLAWLTYSPGLSLEVTSSWKPSLICQIGIRWPLFSITLHVTL